MTTQEEEEGRLALSLELNGFLWKHLAIPCLVSGKVSIVAKTFVFHGYLLIWRFLGAESANRLFLRISTGYWNQRKLARSTRIKFSRMTNIIFYSVYSFATEPIFLSPHHVIYLHTCSISQSQSISPLNLSSFTHKRLHNQPLFLRPSSRATNRTHSQTQLIWFTMITSFVAADSPAR